MPQESLLQVFARCTKVLNSSSVSLANPLTLVEVSEVSDPAYILRNDLLIYQTVPRCFSGNSFGLLGIQLFNEDECIALICL